MKSVEERRDGERPCPRKEWNCTEWNDTEWDGMEWNGMEWY